MTAAFECHHPVPFLFLLLIIDSPSSRFLSFPVKLLAVLPRVESGAVADHMAAGDSPLTIHPQMHEHLPNTACHALQARYYIRNLNFHLSWQERQTKRSKERERERMTPTTNKTRGESHLSISAADTCQFPAYLLIHLYRETETFSVH